MNNWLNKLERKIGKYAVPNLIVWLIGAYCIGFAVNTVNPNMMLMLSLNPYAILHGQIWRLVTWIFMPFESSLIFLLIMAFFYYQLGATLERVWGTFRFNAYLIGGMIFTVIGAFILFGIYSVIYPDNLAYVSMVSSLGFNTNYINMSIFLAFAVMFPDMEVRLYFILPIKMKWMALVYAGLTGYEFITAGWAGKITIAMSLLNFLIFFLSTRNYRRISPKEIHRRQVYRAQTREPRGGVNITKHKCAVCGRTEKDDPTLEFRFCSKCEGNYEYCQDHLFTHAHINRH